MNDRQTTCDVMMIRPANFGSNPETAASNAFQAEAPTGPSRETRGPALLEFETALTALANAGVRVHEFEDSPDPCRPDAVFPNNWVSFHADGTVVLYPMLAPSRRLERRIDLLAELGRRGFRMDRMIDLTHREDEAKYLEGTGSLVLDRVNRKAYACLSPRTHVDVLAEFAQRLDYEIVAFEAHDVVGQPIYHTNVMMSIGRRFAALCLSAIRDHQRAGVLASLEMSGHEIVDLGVSQIYAFAGNMLELETADGKHLVAMSATALASLTSAQRGTLERLAGPIVSTAIPTIERYGGGSLRCMIAEIHLPRR